MADDEKILRIEAKFSEEKAPPKPVSSAGADRVKESGLIQSVRDSLVSGLTDQVDNLKSSVSGLLDPFRQIPSWEAFGGQPPAPEVPEASGGETPPPPSAPSSTSTTSIVHPTIPKYGSGSTKTSNEGAYFPGGINLPPMPTSVASGAAGATTAAAGGAAGGGAIGANVGAAGAGAAGSALATLTGPIGTAVLVFTALAGATSGLTALFLSAFDQLEKQFEDLNAVMSQARAQQELEFTLQKIQSGEKAEAESASLISAETDFYKELIALGEKIINIFGPALEILTELATDFLAIANLVLEAVKVLNVVPLLLMKLVAAIPRFLRRELEGEEPTTDQFNKEATRLFSGNGLDGKLFKRQNFPKYRPIPHSKDQPLLP